MDSKYLITSSRVRLARNVRGLPFPEKLYGEGVYNVILKGATEAADFEYDFYNMGQLSELERNALVEKHLISRGLVARDQIGAVIIKKDGRGSVMVNEEDHIRAQCIAEGLNLEYCYDVINAYDDRLSERLDIAYDSEFGYLTSCITNLGTGMRASCMMFLPALTLAGQMKHVARLLGQKGLTIRGVYGEGSDAEGRLYQISNSCSLGVTEGQILSGVKDAVLKIAEDEAECRYRIFEAEGPYNFEDKVFRAYGVLTSARVLTSKEFMDHMATVKMGISLGVMPITATEKLDGLILNAQPANLCLMEGGRELSAYERDVARAKFVRETLEKLK